MSDSMIEMYNEDYSLNEYNLFKSFGFSDHVMFIDNPVDLYRIVASKAFVDNIQGKNTEILRKCCKAISVCKPYRLTPEFESFFDD